MAITAGIGAKLFASLPIQHKHFFQADIFRDFKAIEETNRQSSALNQVGSFAIDETVSSLLLRSITVPFKTIETEVINGISYTANLNFPEDVTMEFIEIEGGVVMHWLQNWIEDVIIKRDSSGKIINNFNFLIPPIINAFQTSDAQQSIRGLNEYRFRDNQLFAKRLGVVTIESQAINNSLGFQITQGNETGDTFVNAILSNLPSLYPKILLRGLLPLNIDTITLSHEDSETLMYSVNFSVDDVQIVSFLSENITGNSST